MYVYIYIYIERERERDLTAPAAEATALGTIVRRREDEGSLGFREFREPGF